jgi:hypothetical protein
MIKLVLVGVWVSLVTLASSYAAVTWRGGTEASPEVSHESPKSDSGLEHVRPKMISVPIIADGAVGGYVVAQFVFTVDAKDLKRLSVPPEPLLLDEAFKTIYAGESVDFRHFRKQDLPGLSKKIKGGVNKRIGSELVKDVLIQELNYVPKEEARGRIVP